MDKKLTPMMEQYKSIKNKYKDALLLFRLGDFYEAFFEDAKLLSEATQIVLTSRNGYPMAGVPYHSLDQYLKKLIDAGYKIAICDQVEEASKSKKLVKREVTRIITPGTIIEENLLNSEVNNYIVLTSFLNNQYTLVAADISTGDVGVASSEDPEDISDIINKLNPSQLVLQENLKEQRKYIVPANSDIFTEYLENWNFAYSSSIEYIKSFYDIVSPEFLELSKEEIIALGALFKYLEGTHLDVLKHLNYPRSLMSTDNMYLDSDTIENLSLFPSRKKGSLYSSIKETSTSMGSRKLKEWLLNPLNDRKKIEKRLDYVEALFHDSDVLNNIRSCLKDVYDIERILSRLATGKAIPRDLQSLRKTLQILPEIIEQLSSMSVFDEMVGHFPEFQKELSLLENGVMEEPSSVVGSGEVVEYGFNEELDNLRELLSNSKKRLKEFEREEKRKSGINNLKVKYNKVFGYFVEVPKGQTDRVPDYYTRKQTLVNAERYITPEIKEFEEKVLGATERIEDIEHAIFNNLCDELNKSLKKFKLLAELLSELDVYQSNAYIARRRKYCRPLFTKERKMYLKNSRHPVVENYVSDFVSNDIYFDKENSFYILTGPNMSGKSTFIRQVALNVVMAQMGSFVPAEDAVMPVYDRVFTRIGARDDLAGGVSTFLVEMMETATILSKATENSLVVLDEVGRGTSTFDGISIAWAVSEYIYEAIGCHTVFATHFTELTELSSMYENINNLTIKVAERNGEIIFLHKLKTGVASRSHGIEVARLAGIPELVLERASEILKVIVKTSAIDKTVKVLSTDELTKIKKKKKRKMHRDQTTLFDNQ
ncbi:MAG: DNA mismatch repair protein MutS [Kosmotoga sp.]|nr:MAG: DNA mismatch repair protein MutS [Kosmotoga sp.]